MPTTPGRVPTALTTRIGLSAMRLVTFAYLVVAILGLAGTNSALAGHSPIEMSHFRDDSSQMALCEACSSIGIAPKPAESGFVPPKLSSAAHHCVAAGTPMAAPSMVATAGALFALALADDCREPDHQAVPAVAVSALAALRQHAHRSVVLHL